MPSPMPPKPSSSCWASSLKFQHTGPPLLRGAALRAAAGLLIFFAAGFFAAAFFRRLLAGGLARSFLGDLLPCDLHSTLHAQNCGRSFSAFPRGGRDGVHDAVVPAQAGTHRATHRGLWNMGPLSSQTKCNTFLERCCDGAQVRTVVIGGPMRDCPTSSRRALDPANRGSSGSLAIDNFSRAEAQRRPPGRLQTKLRPGADAGAALDGLRLERDPALRRAVLERLARAGRPSRSPAGSPAKPAAR